MNNSDNLKDSANKQFAAVCGLFCPGCSLYIATKEDDKERLARIASMFGVSEEEVKCLGCRSEVKGPYCRMCKMVTCADERGVEFCAQCTDYPCEIIKDFQTAMPHRADLFESGERIKEIGFETWLQETYNEYTCGQCGIINPAYDLACRKCGNEPSCSFVERNRGAIEKYLLEAGQRMQEEE